MAAAPEAAAPEAAAPEAAAPEAAAPEAAAPEAVTPWNVDVNNWGAVQRLAVSAIAHANDVDNGPIQKEAIAYVNETMTCSDLLRDAATQQEFFRRVQQRMAEITEERTIPIPVSFTSTFERAAAAIKAVNEETKLLENQITKKRKRA